MACRRCSVCEGQEHHWIDNYDFGAEGAPLGAYPFVCKHCPAVGDYYSDVEGVDVIDDEDDRIVEVGVEALIARRNDQQGG
jgi:hypothetical protein